MCQIPLRTTLLSNSLAGGTWVYNGYSQASTSGPFTDTATSLPEEFSAALTGDNPTIESEDHSVGFYSLTYTYTDAGTGCSATVDVVLPIVQGVTNGTNSTITTCTDSTDVYNLFELISGGDGLGGSTSISPDQTGTWTVTPVGSHWNTTTVTGATLDLNQVSTAGTYTATYTLVDAVGPSGFTQASGCVDCDGSSVTATFTVNAAGNAGVPQNVFICN